MSDSNLICEPLKSKWRETRRSLSRLAVSALLALLAVSCSETGTGVPEEYVLNGTYYITKIARTQDGVAFEELVPPNVGGVIKIIRNYYFRDMILGQERDVDEGEIEILGSVILFYSETRDDTLKGTYDLEKDSFKLNYTRDEFLYIENWQSVQPVDNPT
ncbi:MAG: hypothetical protein U9P14_00920 [Gemmatimonadota bacterium]|nr:hypothetical protein [Gemmatimonadota bacterium]